MKKINPAVFSFLFPVFTGIVFCGMFVTRQQWVLVGIVFFVNFIWLLNRVFKQNWLPSLILVGNIIIAGFYLMQSGSAFMAVCGVILSLVGWELSDLENVGGDPQVNRQTKRFETQRLTLLGISSLISLIIAGLGMLIKINLSFWFIFVIVLFVIFSFYKLITVLDFGR